MKYLIFTLALIVVISGCTNEFGGIDNIERALETGNVSECSDMNVPELKDICMTSAALSAGDSSICDNVKGVMQRDSCNTGVAIQNQDDTICDKIDDQEQKEFCVELVKDAKG